MIRFLLSALLLTLAAAPVHAETIVLDKDDWKIGIGGIVEFDAITDNRGGLEEVVGNKAMAQTGYDNNVGRTQFSMRNSRFSISATAPDEGGMKTRGYLEFDLLGYDPNPYTSLGNGAGTTPANSESGFFTNPTLRLRHAYLTTEHGSHKILIGQTWSLFGWQPQYVLSTISVQPVSGTMYERTPQAMYMNTQDGDTHNLQSAVSVSRPSQRNSMIPNFEAGVKWSYKPRKSGFAAANSDIKLQPMSVGLSGAMRTFVAPTATSNVSQSQTAGAYAVDAQIPLLAADGDSAAGSLTLTAEYTNGVGDADEFPGWSGGLGQLVNANNATQPNLDPGYGGLDGNNNLELAELDSMNVQLQYHLSSGFFDVGYGLLHSNNIANIPSNANPYDRAETIFVNYLHNCTAHLRMGLEYAQFTTHYTGGTKTTVGSVSDNREMLASYYRF